MTQPDALTRKFTDQEVLHFEGRGGKLMSYVEDESVMDRLDEAFGIGGWSIRVEPIPVYEGVVKVRLEAGGAVYEDFGYPNRDGGEALKEAVSDGIRRCGRYLGIARDLYRRPTHPQTSPGRPSTAQGGSAARSISPRPAAPTTPPEPDYLAGAFGAPATGSQGHEAPDNHGPSMTVKEVLAAADAAGITTKEVGDTARKLWGKGMLKELDGEQRAAVWAELAR